MEKKTMGNFMAALRKANGYTQQQIADKLNVSNKTISKWECDDGYPEISMLPAIAEIYGVTVDELLRGEKSTQTAEKETNNQKAEEQIKYLCDKTFSKFNNSSIISIALGLCSFIIAYLLLVKVSFTAYLFIQHPIYILFAFIAFALCATSVVFILIAFNNLTSKINANDIIDKQAFYNKLSKCISLLSLDIALAVASTFTLAASLMVEGGTAWYIILGMPIAFLSIITGLLVRSALYKKYGVTCFDISPEKQKYRKKYNKITAICFFVIVLLNLAAPLVDAMLNSNVSYYTFADGYYYETIEDAERDYYKVKNHITGDKKLYDEDWCEGQYAETGEYILEVTEIKYEFDYDEKKGYDFLDLRYVDYKTFTFKTEEEREQFKEEFEKENVYKNDGLSIDMLKKGVEFDDENLTIKYEQRFRMSGVYDVMPVSILLIFCEVLVVLIVMTIVYKKKTKNL